MHGGTGPGREYLKLRKDRKRVGSARKVEVGLVDHLEARILALRRQLKTSVSPDKIQTEIIELMVRLERHRIKTRRSRK